MNEQKQSLFIVAKEEYMSNVFAEVKYKLFKSKEKAESEREKIIKVLKDDEAKKWHVYQLFAFMKV